MKLRNIFKHKHRWAVTRTIWPYKEGYGVYCKKCRMALETGITLEEAKGMADLMNGVSI